MELTPDLLAAIQQAVADGKITLPTNTGRSPIRDRQLHDLRLLPSATDPRPLFLPSAEAPRDAAPYVRGQFPTLRWHKATGVEVCARNAKDLALYSTDEYTAIPVHLEAADPLRDAQAALDTLPVAEREVIINNAKDLKLKRIQDQLAALAGNDLETVLLAAKMRTEAEVSSKKKTA